MAVIPQRRGGQMRTEEEVETAQRPLIDLDAPTTTYRISVDVDMVPADMPSEQACGLLIAALETAYTVVRAVRVNQCSTLTKDGLHLRGCDEPGLNDHPLAR
jgi:hypothetical protein